jgi:hypothetical protein
MQALHLDTAKTKSVEKQVWKECVENAAIIQRIQTEKVVETFKVAGLTVTSVKDLMSLREARRRNMPRFTG